MSDTDDLVDALQPVVEVLRKLGVAHYVSGSVASSFHGATRTTMDVDIVCDLTEDQIALFTRSFDDRYYLSEAAIRDAVSRHSCFNLIHMPTAFKVDVFVSKGRPYDVMAMRRASLERLGTKRFVEVPVATAEDSIISKLEWYRLTDETSERQWDDVSKLIKLLGSAADVGYLRESADSVGVGDLLSRLLEQN